jgi:NADH dehydrogenase [ubiquinone] 1 alpha subcomplex assembly factor 7
MSSDVAARIRRRIVEDGPITFAEFMNEALYGPGGFYETTPVGPRGHFVTSPHVHPMFSRLVGAALEKFWVLLGRPSPLRVVEVGAGDGTMAWEIVAGFERAGIHLSYEAVEVSPAAHEALSAVTPAVAETLAELQALDPGVVIANELLDNLPFLRIRVRDGDLVEIRVGVEGDSFVEVERPLDEEGSVDRLLIDDALMDSVPPSAEGEDAVVPSGALWFVDDLGVSLRRGYAVLIDYASTNTKAEGVHGYRDHRVLNDVFDDPGSADITAGVDLDAIARRARRNGLEAFETVSQRDALIALGLEEWLRDELEHQGRMLEQSRGLEAARTFGGRSRARLLADPAGLGRLRWLVLATAGLPEPAWLHAARNARPTAD